MHHVLTVLEPKRIPPPVPEPAPARVLMIGTRSDAIGGSNTYMLNLATHLKNHGIDTMIASGGNGIFADMTRDAGIPYIPLAFMTREVHPLKDLAAVREIKRIITITNPDLLSLQTSKAGAIGRLAAIGTHKPITYTPHAWAFAEGTTGLKKHAYAIIERALAPHATTIINVSEADHRDAQNHAIGKPHQHKIIPNGVHDIPTHYLADPTTQPPTITMIARFEPQKDHVTLIHALATLKHRPWKLQLIGNGPQRPSIQALTRELGIHERCVFLGEVRDVPAHLARTQVHVLVSRWEGLPLTILEAMRAGLPTVATNVGGNPEAITNNEGILVPPGDAKAVAEALEVLIMNPNTRAALGRNARERYLRHYTADRMLNETLAVMLDALANAR